MYINIINIQGHTELMIGIISYIRISTEELFLINVNKTIFHADTNRSKAHYLILNILPNY